MLHLQGLGKEGGGSSWESSSQPGQCINLLLAQFYVGVKFPPSPPWLRGCGSLPANPAGWGSGLSDGWVSVEGTLVPQQAPALVHRTALGWAGQRSELCRDRLWALLAVPLQMPARSHWLEQEFSCPESSHGILLGSGSG